VKKSVFLLLSLCLFTALIAAELPLKIGFLYVGPVGDEGWSYAHDLGRLSLEARFGDRVETVYRESVPEGAETGATVEELILEGCKVIFGTSFGFSDALYDYSLRYPEVHFFQCSGIKTGHNLSTYFGRIYEPSFLAGLAAGSMTRSGKIGYVAPVETPEVIRIANGFALGVRAINPEARVYLRWTGSWYDPDLEESAAAALINRKCDVIAQQTDSSAPAMLSEQRDVWAIGYNSDMSQAAPTKMLTSSVWDWGIYYTETIERVLDGTYRHVAFWEGMDSGLVGLTPLSDRIPEETRKLVQDYERRMLSGDFHPFRGPLYDQGNQLRIEAGRVMTDEELLSMSWFVDNVVTSAP